MIKIVQSIAIDYRNEEATWQLVERPIARDINRRSLLKDQWTCGLIGYTGSYQISTVDRESYNGRD